MVGSRITKRMVDSLKVTAAEYVAWDGDIPGFGVRVRPSGSKSYIVQYRAGAGRKAPTRKLTLGAVGKLAPDEARNLARKAVGSIAHGLDPAGSRADDRSVPDRSCPSEATDGHGSALQGYSGTDRHPGAWDHQGEPGESVRPRQASPEMEADALSGESDRGGCRQHVQLCRQSRAGGGGAQPGARDREIPRKWTRAVPFDRRTGAAWRRDPQGGNHRYRVVRGRGEAKFEARSQAQAPHGHWAARGGSDPAAAVHRLSVA
jgi:hypothetical protein